MSKGFSQVPGLQDSVTGIGMPLALIGRIGHSSHWILPDSLIGETGVIIDLSTNLTLSPCFTVSTMDKIQSLFFMHFSVRMLGISVFLLRGFECSVKNCVQTWSYPLIMQNLIYHVNLIGVFFLSVVFEEK